MPKKIELTGERFGRLLVVKDSGFRMFGKVAWECRCDCGKMHIVLSPYLRSGDTKSCGCLNGATTHGKSYSKVYLAWSNMMSRCYNETASRHHLYKAKGITVCERWHTFENFYEDMRDPPSDNHTLDRIDNAGNYEMSNCRWATQRVQGNNRDTNRFVTYLGRTQTIAEWGRELGIPRNIVYKRIKQNADINTAFRPYIKREIE